ncbi:UNVERIFIED_CONTAM: hypothetical protein HDU68_008965 [Siphonaria sp. JEL0065]|nr:hypothetical protein HDU68_008965 [Siphonaria sp. JEL0065]
MEYSGEITYEYDPDYSSVRHASAHDQDYGEEEQEDYKELPSNQELVQSHHKQIQLDVYEINPIASSYRETPIAKVNRLKKEADALHSLLLDNLDASGEIDDQVFAFVAFTTVPLNNLLPQTQAMLIHLNTVFYHLEEVTPVAEAIAANGPLSQTQFQLIDPKNPRGKKLIKRLSKFKRYAEKSASPNPFVKDSTLQMPSNVTATQVYNVMYAKQDEDEFLPDMDVLCQRISSLESAIGAALPQQPQHQGRQRATSASTRLPSTITSTPPLPFSTMANTAPRRSSLDASLADSTTRLKVLLSQLSIQPETPMETLMANISKLQQSQKDLAETPAPDLKSKTGDEAWQLVTTPSKSRRSKKQDLIKNMPPPTQSQQRIQKLQENVYPLDKLISSIPVLVGRLETLAPIHTRGALLSDALSGVLANHKGSLQELNTLEGLAGLIDKNVSENMAVCQRNWDAFDIRIKELERRLKDGGGKNTRKIASDEGVLKL